MKSVKPGRGPSALTGLMCLAVAALAVIWTISALSMGAGIMVPFGIIFVLISLGVGIYQLYNAAAQNRMSDFDIVDGKEEPDPLNRRFGSAPRFCPHCGEQLPENARYCPGCGEKAEQNTERNDAR